MFGECFLVEMSGRDKKGYKEGLHRPGRPKKVKFHGNQYTRGRKEPEAEPTTSSRSAQKLRTSDEFIPEINTGIIYVILEFFTVFSAISEAVACKTCGGALFFSTSNERGLGFKINVKCASKTCPLIQINSCPNIRNGYEVNSRITLAMRLLGIGHAGLQIFCGIMDLHPPVHKSFYYEICKKICEASSTVADYCMRKAANEEKKATHSLTANKDPEDITISIDGSWMKRGFTSLFGIVAAIGEKTGKVIDLTVKSMFCKACEMWEKRFGTEEYMEFIDTHWPNCSANFEGSSGGMEVSGALEIFNRSLETRNVRYCNYVADGDSKTQKAITEAQPYGPNKPVVKKECVNHVSKRMGTRLRNLVKKEPQLKGRGKLTGADIDKLSGYYGKAIRNNPESATEMKKAIWATFFHRASTNEDPQHFYCPEGEDSWCGWQRAAMRNEEYDHQEVPQDVINAIEPIYKDLTKEELLEKCTGAHNQNNNESFNGLVWQMAPKIQFNGSLIVQTASNIAVCIFNEGHNTVMKIMEELGITVGSRCQEQLQQRNESRVSKAEAKMAAATKEARISLREARRRAQEDAIEEEGVLYGPGIDSEW